MEIIHTGAELAQRLDDSRPRRFRPHDGQPARRPPARCAGSRARTATPSSRASSSTACSSGRTRTSTATRARWKRIARGLEARRRRRAVRARTSRRCIRRRRSTACSRRPLADELEGAFRPGLLRRRVHGRAEALQPGAARCRGVRQEGPPAAQDRARHGAAVQHADRDRAGRDGARRRRPGAVVAQRLPDGRPSARRRRTCTACCAGSPTRSPRGARDYANLEVAGRAELAARGWKVDYIADPPRPGAAHSRIRRASITRTC